MKVGISTACFYPRSPAQALEHIAALGLRTIEIFFNTESEFQKPYCDLLAQKLRENHLSLVSVHPFTSLMEGFLLFSDYEQRTEDGIEQYRRYFAAASGLGARYLTLHGDRLLPGRIDSEAAIERKLMQYDRLCRTAKEEGIIVAQENVAWCRSSDPDYLKLLYDNVPQLCYTLDIKQAHRANRSWKEYLSVVAPRLVNVHINDFDNENSCLLPGEGTLDYSQLFGALRSAGYDEQVLIEVYSADYSKERQISDAAEFLFEQAQASGYEVEK